MMYILIITAFLAALISILIIRTLLFKPRLIDKPVVTDSEPQFDVRKAALHLGEAIQFRTVSNSDDTKTDWAEFEKFRDWLKKTYPLTHNTLERETVICASGRCGASLLYKWKGTSSHLKPFALLAHMDVVPAEEATLNNWKHPPFSGTVTDTEVFGRGACDMKNQLVAIFETVETLINEGYTPQRDIYICLGHNEEVQVGDASGARAIAKLLKERGVRFEFVLDEGGAVLEDPPFNLDKPVAMIGVAEKGYVDIRLTAFDEGGHAAEPPEHTALGILSQAIAALETRPMKQKLISPVTLTFDSLCRFMKFPLRLVMANLWLFKKLVLFIMAKDRQTNAMTRTTIAATMAEASPAPNVLPQRASCILNVRLLPGETKDDVLKHIKCVINKTKVKIQIEPLKDSHAIKTKEGFSSLNTYTRAAVWPPVKSISYRARPEGAYKTILECLPVIKGAESRIIPSPYLLTGATDSREYEPVTDEIYRFYPFILNTQELNSMHADNERIRIDSLAGALRFNYHFIKKAGSINE